MARKIHMKRKEEEVEFMKWVTSITGLNNNLWDKDRLREIGIPIPYPPNIPSLPFTEDTISECASTHTLILDVGISAMETYDRLKKSGVLETDPPGVDCWTRYGSWECLTVNEPPTWLLVPNNLSLPNERQNDRYEMFSPRRLAYTRLIRAAHRREDWFKNHICRTNMEMEGGGIKTAGREQITPSRKVPIVVAAYQNVVRVVPWVLHSSHGIPVHDAHMRKPDF